MVTVKEIKNIIEKTSPLELAEEWDNSGLIYGDDNKEVKTVYITLDVFKENINEAVKLGVDMIISHHPILFRGIKQVDTSTQEGYVLKKLIENDIALYAAHTSLDSATGGINDVLAKKLGISDTQVIEENKNYRGCGLGRIGNVKKTTVRELAEGVKRALKTPFVRVCGDLDKEVKRVAVGGGACDDLIMTAKGMGADVMVTADMKYHIAAEAADANIPVIDAGHYPTEVFAIDIFCDLLKNVDVKIYKSTAEDIFKLI